MSAHDYADTPRDKHLAWCKERALEYVERGELTEAFGSMTSDLLKHPELREHVGLVLGMAQLMTGHLNTEDSMSDYIEGFN